MNNLRNKIINKARRVIVKVGSTVITSSEEGRGPDIFRTLAEEIKFIMDSGREVAVVSSGSIATGMRKMGLKERPVSIPERQAIAATGQVSLMALYDAAFTERGMKAAQVLLTHDDLASRKRFLNARNTMTALFKLGMVPVINENDTVAVDEIKFGDNDELSALAANLVGADLLVILTDIDGLYDGDPRSDKSAKLIPVVEDVDSLKLDWLGGPASRFGTGGMRTKTEAAKKAAHFGAATIIANGFTPGILKNIFEGGEEGTLFLPREDRLTSRKHWIAFSTRPTGRVFVDDGARAALLEKKKSLLPSGIKSVDGAFDAGEVVHCVDSLGMEFARGVSNYSSEEIKRIKGIKSAEIEKILGYKVYDEVIHRDNLVVL